MQTYTSLQKKHDLEHLEGIPDLKNESCKSLISSQFITSVYKSRSRLSTNFSMLFTAICVFRQHQHEIQEDVNQIFLP